MQAMVYTPAMQASGQFDGGKIRERKPIGFPGEGSVVKRVGPLFYWAWAESSEEAVIGLHPHQGFEIVTYVLEGRGYHRDTLGTSSVVGPGGAQAMRTGSGVSHEERLGAGTQLLQIWFEPDLEQAVRRAPSYLQAERSEFPRIERPDEGYEATLVIGPDTPIRLTADAAMRDVAIGAGMAYAFSVPDGYTMAALAVRGEGAWTNAAEGQAFGEPTAFRERDFMTASAYADTEVRIRNVGEEELRMILIQVPTAVDYPLLRKR